MKTTYFNRYGDNIIFEKIDSNTIKMSGFIYSRTGFNEDGSKIEFIDPAGGPFLAVGMNLCRYFNTKKEIIIKSIERTDGGAVLTV